MFQPTVAPLRRLTPQPADSGCGWLFPEGWERKNDFTGFAALSGSLFPLRGEV